MSGNGKIDIAVQVPSGTKIAIAIYNKSGYSKSNQIIDNNHRKVKQSEQDLFRLQFHHSERKGMTIPYFHLDNNGCFIIKLTAFLADNQRIQLDGTVKIEIERKQGGGEVSLRSIRR